MRKTFAAFVAVSTIVGLLAAKPASAQRGVAAPARHHEPVPYGAGRGPYDDFGSCEMGYSVSGMDIAGVPVKCEFAAHLRCGETCPQLPE